MHHHHEHIGDEADWRGLAGALSAIVGIPLVLTLLLPVERIPSNVLNLFVSFAFGCLLADIFGHILPEHLHHGHADEGTFVIAGVVAFILLDILVSQFHNSAHHHHHNHSHGHLDHESSKEDEEGNVYVAKSPVETRQHRPRQRKRANKTLTHETEAAAEHSECKHDTSKSSKSSLPVLMLLGNVMHTIMDGMQLALAFSSQSSSSVAIASSLAILMHEIPHKLSDYAVNLKSGYSKFQCITMQLVMSLGTLLGCAAVLVFKRNMMVFGDGSHDMESKLMLISAGGLIYTCMVGILPDLLQQARSALAKLLVVFIGIFAGILFVLGQHHEHSHKH